jgi:hypothetical protein
MAEDRESSTEKRRGGDGVVDWWSDGFGVVEKETTAARSGECGVIHIVVCKIFSDYSLP